MSNHKEKVVGTSFSGCVRSLVNREQSLDDVELVYTDVDKANLLDNDAFELMLSTATRVWCANDGFLFKARFKSVARTLYKKGKLVPYEDFVPPETTRSYRKELALAKLGLERWGLWQRRPNTNQQ